MFLLIFICALIGAAAIAVAMVWHKRRDDALSALGGDAGHETWLYRQFLADTERRLAAGEIGEAEAEDSRREAARALLKAVPEPVADASPDVAIGRPVFAVLFMTLAVAAGLFLYLAAGRPDYPDQPYAQRLQGWVDANPDSLPAPAWAAVLRAGAPAMSDKIAYWYALGQAEYESGNPYAAAKAYQEALRRDSAGFAGWFELGQALTATAGRVTADAETAFARAVERDPNDGRARYFLGHAAAERGDYETAQRELLFVKSVLGDDAQAQAALTAELEGIERAATAQPDIRGMVASLQARLEADPEDADGWARLLRAYTVLGDVSAHQGALAEMRAHYASRVAVADDIERRSRAAVGSERVAP